MRILLANNRIYCQKELLSDNGSFHCKMDYARRKPDIYRQAYNSYHERSLSVSYRLRTTTLMYGGELCDCTMIIVKFPHCGLPCGLLSCYDKIRGVADHRCNGWSETVQTAFFYFSGLKPLLNCNFFVNILP